jgi:hypothetical protein
MLSDTGTDSLWMVSSPPEVRPPLTDDLRADVCATNTPVIDWLVIHKAVRVQDVGDRGTHSAGLRKTGQEDDGMDRFGRLEAWARKRFPACSNVPGPSGCGVFTPLPAART